MKEGRERFSQRQPDEATWAGQGFDDPLAVRGTRRSAPASLSTATWAPDLPARPSRRAARSQLALHGPVRGVRVGLLREESPFRGYMSGSSASGRPSMPDPGPQPAPRILHIEDNPESRALVRSVLEPRGFDVLEASDGMAGIDLAIASHPDLILCDIQLPGLDGYETARRRRSYKGLEQCPIVVLTSHGDRVLSLSIGCDGYIEQPIDVEKFPGQ